MRVQIGTRLRALRSLVPDTSRPEGSLRAVGVRVGFDALPEAVLDWVAARLGSPVAAAQAQVGGMSPGPAARLVTRSGDRAFLKAVSRDLNADTLDLYRYEANVLSYLPPAPYRVPLLGIYDDGRWVALLMEDVEGRHPHLAEAADRAVVTDLVRCQSGELTPPPAGVERRLLSQNAVRWAQRWSRLRGVAPGWVTARFDELLARVNDLPNRLAPSTLCHWDVREDNLLIRGDGSAVVFDWGISRLGPPWADELLLAAAVRRPDDVHRVMDRHRGSADLILDVLLALAGSQAAAATEPKPPSLPTIAEFQRADAARLFAIAKDLID